MKSSGKSKFPEYIKANLDKYKYVLIVCGLGLILALWPFTPADKPEAEPAAAGEISQGAYDAGSLAAELEVALESVEGVGRIKIILTVKSGFESVYAYDQTRAETGGQAQTSSSTNTQLVTVSGGGEESPVVRKVNYPVFMGAVVICDGGDSAKIKLELTQAIKSLTGISADCIVVTKMKD